jgi:hypothetical protein
LSFGFVVEQEWRKDYEGELRRRRRGGGCFGVTALIALND